MQDYKKRSDVHVIGFPEREQKKSMAEKLYINLKEVMSKQLIIKFLKTKDRKNLQRSTREVIHYIQQKKTIRMLQTFIFN